MEQHVVDVASRMNVVFVGHVDHGKSTTIGRLCYDTGTLSPDKMAEVERVSRELGRPTEFAFVMDHLEEERTGGLTIDTAQMFFRSASRHYVIIDAPGHKEFLKNMITGATQAEAALLVIDAAEGLREQSRRHAFLLSMFNVRSIVVVLNKMDLTGYSKARFEAVCGQMVEFLAALGLEPAFVVPISAAYGDNVVHRSNRMPWYDGPTVLEALDALEKRAAPIDRPLRFPIQDVYRIDERNIIVGRVEAGTVRQGDTACVLPTGQSVQVLSVEELGRTRFDAQAGESVGLTLEPSSGLRRGQVLCDPYDQPQCAARWGCSLFCMTDREVRRGEPLLVRLATQERPARVVQIMERIDASTLKVLEHDAALLAHAEVGKVILEADPPLIAEPFAATPEMGRFVLEMAEDVVGAGTVIGVES